MIEGSEALLAAAEIAIGLAGFSGVVAAFSRTREFPPEDRVRFLMLVGGAFFVVLLAFVPILLDLAGLSPSAVWRISSLFWLIGVGLGLPLLAHGRRIILAHGRPAPLWSLALILLITSLAAAAQLGNVFEWPYSAGAVPYLVGLLAGLLGSGTIFVYLVLIRPSTMTESDEGTVDGSATYRGTA